MKGLFHIYLLVVSISLAFTGCYYDNEQELYPGAATCDTTVPVTFSGTIKPLIQNRCAVSGCHAGSQSPDLRNDQTIKQHADNGSLKARVIDRIPPAMPPGGPLPPCEIQQLQAWLDQGAPMN